MSNLYRQSCLKCHWWFLIFQSVSISFLLLQSVNMSLNENQATFHLVIPGIFYLCIVCGPGILNLADGESRNITSPNFNNGGPYPTGKTCVWLIKVSHEWQFAKQISSQCNNLIHKIFEYRWRWIGFSMQPCVKDAAVNWMRCRYGVKHQLINQ